MHWRPRRECADAAAPESRATRRAAGAADGEPETWWTIHHLLDQTGLTPTWDCTTWSSPREYFLKYINFFFYLSVVEIKKKIVIVARKENTYGGLDCFYRFTLGWILLLINFNGIEKRKKKSRVGKFLISFGNNRHKVFIETRLRRTMTI